MCYLWRLILYLESIQITLQLREKTAATSILSDFAKKIIFAFIASYLAIQGSTTQNREGEHLSGSRKNEDMKRKKMEGK